MKLGGHHERIHPDVRTWSRECPACRARTVFLVNPAAPRETGTPF